MYDKALKFATKAHAGQVRKFTGEDYITHPVSVAAIVRSVNHTDEMVAAALLHDVVEDTPITNNEIRVEFGDKVADLVGWLTDVGGPAANVAHIAKAPANAQSVKLADIISNTSNIEAMDDDFKAYYLPLKRKAIAVLTKGDPALINLALAGCG
jgi:(p)ppGpp synthase/HD superfamily hydrolase